ncbi:MAG: hypothetical protein GY904_00550 [Planctomycetaceae bacterium]|jgi:hypothetical protein|nr:hypothetical protein [Planctomycetaceae bacterium]
MRRKTDTNAIIFQLTGYRSCADESASGHDNQATAFTGIPFDLPGSPLRVEATANAT